MDTDDLSFEAWDIIVRAARVSDTLKAELGTLAGKVAHEDAWLQDIRTHLQMIVDDPDDYVDFWNLEKYENLTAGKVRELAADLFSRVNQVLAIPTAVRHPRP